MGHEAILYGRILGAREHSDDSRPSPHNLNRIVLDRLPQDDEWPWLVRGMFALPAGFPVGTYRHQVIHFGASIKDDPWDRGVWDVWLGKFEGLLRQLFWSSAVVHLETDFEPTRVFTWRPTDEALKGIYAEPARPITEWTRTVQIPDLRRT